MSALTSLTDEQLKLRCMELLVEGKKHGYFSHTLKGDVEEFIRYIKKVESPVGPDQPL